VERFTGSAEMERSESSLNWQTHAPKPADMSLKAAFGGAWACEG